MDCFVASAPVRKRFAFVAGNDGKIQSGLVVVFQEVVHLV
jgi:hypothetical protein